ncbi:hypothetical protein [Halovulum sp. GXIMD14793]
MRSPPLPSSTGLRVREVGSRQFVEGQMMDIIAGRAASLAREEQYASLALNSVVGVVREGGFETWGAAHCGGLYDAVCMAAFQRQGNFENLQDSTLNALLMAGGGVTCPPKLPSF